MLSNDPTRQRVRVALCDPFPIFRLGLEALLNQHPDIEVVHSSDDFDNLLGLDCRPEVDALVIDLSASGAEALDSMAYFQRVNRGLEILAFIKPGELASIIPPPQLTIRGFQVKTSRTRDIVSSVMDVSAGRPVVAPDLTDEFVSRLSQTPPSPKPETPMMTALSQRQAQVLNMIAQGRTNIEIARKLRISEPTVKFHVSSIFSKLRVKNRTEAASVLTRLRAQVA